MYAPDVLLQSLQVAISYLCHSLVVALTFGSLSLKLQLLHLLLVLLNLVHQFLLALPFGSEGVLLLTQLGNLFVQLCQLRLVVLAFYRLAFYLQLCQLTRYLVQLLRHAVTLHPQLCCRLVHQVYRLVGQETVGDVSLRELHGSDAGIILYTYLVMVLVSLLQTSQYGDGAQLVRLVHHHRLEPSLQRLVLLKVFLVFVQRRGAYGTQLATSQRRLQDVGSIHRTLAAAGTHQRVYLVDEQYDVAVALGHLLDYALQSLLELTLVFSSSHQLSHVERVELLVLQVLRHVAPDDTSSQALHDGSLTRTRLANQYRVVLRPS